MTKFTFGYINCQFCFTKSFKEFFDSLKPLIPIFPVNDNNCNSVWITRANSRKESSQELTQFSPRSHPRHFVEKRTALNKTTAKTSAAIARWTGIFYTGSHRIVCFKYLFYLFSFLNLTRRTINNHTKILKLNHKRTKRLVKCHTHCRYPE